MTTIDDPAAEKAIDALLQEHARVTTGDPGRAEVETQCQYLERKSNALESQLVILNEAKKAARKGDLDTRAWTFDLLDWDQGLTGGIGPLYGNAFGARYRTPGLVNHNFGPSHFGVALRAPDLLDWRRNRVERSNAEGHNLGVAPVPQALKIYEWCQETIENIATRLTPDQIKTRDRDLALTWSQVILGARLQQRILALGKQLAALRQQQNGRLPISQLPLEILIQVFDFVLTAEPPERRDETFILCTVLMRICRDWTHIIQNTPGLWNRISPYSSSLREVTVALNKSRPCPLRVWFNSAEMHHIAFRHFLDLITKHLDRWNALELDLTGWDPIALNDQLGEAFPPGLRRLRVSMKPQGWGFTPYDPRIRLFGGRWPSSLKHLGIVGCGMDSSRYAELQGLATLEISRLPSGQEVDVAEILHILSNCPGIESLTLSGRTVWDKQPTLLNPGLVPVRLDRLREISLSLELDPMNSLLRSIQIGSCAKFCIEAIQPPRSKSAWTESLLTHGIRPFVRVLDSILSSASAVSIKADRKFLKLSTSPSESDLVVSLTFHGTGLAEVGRWMANSLTLGPAPVTLYFAAKGAEWVETLPLILSNFTHIVELTFVGLGIANQQAIDFLGTPIHTEAAGHKHFPAPRLAHMDVMGEYIPNIIHMVERRQSAELGGVGRPVKLSKLVLRRNLYGESLDNETIGRLLSDLGGGEVKLSIV